MTGVSVSSTERNAAMPSRIQRRRTKGWRAPLGAVYVGRGTMWGNYAAQRVGLTEGEVAVSLFRDWIRHEASWAWKGRMKIDLRGKNLMCWCPLNRACHADILIELANADPALSLTSPESNSP